eukprot:193184-Hanusia_phi.AAC.1
MEAWRLLINAALASASTQAGDGNGGGPERFQQLAPSPLLTQHLERCALEEKDGDGRKDRVNWLLQGRQMSSQEQLRLLLSSLSGHSSPQLSCQSSAPILRDLAANAGGSFGAAEAEEQTWTSGGTTRSVKEEEEAERSQRLKEKSLQKKKQRAKKGELLKQLAALLPPPGDAPAPAPAPAPCGGLLTKECRRLPGTPDHLRGDRADGCADLGGCKDADSPSQGACMLGGGGWLTGSQGEVGRSGQTDRIKEEVGDLELDHSRGRGRLTSFYPSQGSRRQPPGSWTARARETDEDLDKPAVRGGSGKRRQ